MDIQMELGPIALKLETASFHQASWGAHLNLGQPLFLQAIVEMDFDARRLTVIHPDAFTPPTEKPLRVKSWKAVPTIQITLSGRSEEICLIVDTGFNGGIGVTPEMANKLDLKRHPGGGVRAAEDGYGNRVLAPELAPLQEVRVGDHIYRDVPIMGAIPNSVGRCGNLGMALLSRSRIVFDLKNQRMWLLPRAGTGE
jgi:hypothetical protein